MVVLASSNEGRMPFHRVYTGPQLRQDVKRAWQNLIINKWSNLKWS